MTKIEKRPGGKMVAPDNFVELAARLCRRHVAKEIGVHEQTVERWEYDLGIKCIAFNQSEASKKRVQTINKNRKPRECIIPDDFKSVAHLLTVKQSMERWEASEPTIYRWLKLSNISAAKKYGKPAPDDFSEKAPNMNKSMIASFYGVHGNVVERWLKETNVQCKKYDARQHCLRTLRSPQVEQKRRAARARKMAQKPIANKGKVVFERISNKTHITVAGNDMRTYGADTVAADALRNNRWTVSRCNEQGNFSHSGTFYRVGAKPLMDTKSMIDTALRICRKLDDPEFDWMRGYISAKEWLDRLYQSA